MKEDKYKLKNRTRMSTALDTELWERLKKVSSETMMWLLAPLSCYGQGK